LFKQIDYVMIGVSNMKQSVDFYKNTMGMPLKFESNEWTEFMTGSTTLALHLTKMRVAPVTGQREMLAGTSTIGFNVEDIDATFRELKAKSVRFAMEPKIREGEGIKLAVCLDPDGLEISLAQTLKEPLRAESHAN